jgi:hypothetical protein
MKHLSREELVVQSNPTRRIMFGAIGAILVVAFVLGIDWRSESERQLITGLVFYFSLVAVSVAVAGWNKSLIVDSGSSKEVRFVNTLFGLPVRRSRIGIDEIEAVTLQRVKLLGGKPNTARPALGSSPFGGIFSRRGSYFKLSLELAETRHFLEDSTDGSELEAIGTEMARAIGVDFRTEDL